jgi:hypothetical protein
MTERAHEYLQHIKTLHGVKRFSEFLKFLGELAE